ncbi:hypothetical protein WA538_003409, partial [Blastocystis sp. DL]
MNTILNKIVEQLEVVDKQLEGYEWLSNISKKVNIRPSLLSIIFSLLSSLLCFHLFGPSLLANLLCCIYPIYWTLGLLISHSSEEYVKCMIYWSLFAFLYLFESLFTDISANLPFYYPFKVSLLYAVIGKEIALYKVIYQSVLTEYFGFPDLSEEKRAKVIETIKNSDIN